jgi:hypothetical protein
LARTRLQIEADLQRSASAEWPADQARCVADLSLLTIADTLAFQFRLHVELMVPDTGPKVFVTPPACSRVRQRTFACGGETTAVHDGLGGYLPLPRLNRILACS